MNFNSWVYYHEACIKGFYELVGMPIHKEGQRPESRKRNGAGGDVIFVEGKEGIDIRI